MDPDTGASTCALGSHKCKPNMGSLIKNPKKTANNTIHLTLLGMYFINLKNNQKCLSDLNNHKILNKIGKDPTIV